jgi:hypothetical protein
VDSLWLWIHCGFHDDWLSLVVRCSCLVGLVLWWHGRLWRLLVGVRYFVEALGWRSHPVGSTMAVESALVGLLRPWLLLDW